MKSNIERQIILVVILLFSFSNLHAHEILQKPHELFPLIDQSKPDTKRIALLNQLGGYYIFKPGNNWLL